MATVSEIDFMEDTFIDHDDDMINNSVDVEEIEPEDIEEEIANSVTNQEQIANGVNISGLKPNIIQTNESDVGETDNNGELFFFFIIYLINLV